jgi:hypothetical protein
MWLDFWERFVVALVYERVLQVLFPGSISIEAVVQVHRAICIMSD